MLELTTKSVAEAVEQLLSTPVEQIPEGGSLALQGVPDGTISKLLERCGGKIIITITGMPAELAEALEAEMNPLEGCRPFGGVYFSENKQLDEFNKRMAEAAGQ